MLVHCIRRYVTEIITCFELKLNLSGSLDRAGVVRAYVHRLSELETNAGSTSV